MMFLHNWENIEDMRADFWPEYESEKEGNALSGANILLASYGTPSYEGYAFVLFEKEGKLYEVNGGHCSCYGLEGQWDPEETTATELRHRMAEGSLGDDDYTENCFKDELDSVLSKIAE